MTLLTSILLAVLFLTVSYILYMYEGQKKFNIEVTKFLVTTSFALEWLRKTLEETKKEENKPNENVESSN